MFHSLADLSAHANVHQLFYSLMNTQAGTQCRSTIERPQKAVGVTSSRETRQPPQTLNWAKLSKHSHHISTRHLAHEWIRDIIRPCRVYRSNSHTKECVSLLIAVDIYWSHTSSTFLVYSFRRRDNSPQLSRLAITVSQ